MNNYNNNTKNVLDLVYDQIKNLPFDEIQENFNKIYQKVYTEKFKHTQNNIKQYLEKSFYKDKLQKDIDNNLMNNIKRPNVTYDWNKETQEIMIHFGKNGHGLTDEFIIIGEFIKKLSEKANVYITEAFIDGMDDVYDIKLHYIYK